MFGSRHSCLEFRSRDGVRTLALHFLSLCECAVSSSLGTAHSCPRVFCCCTQFVLLSSACICYLLCCVARSLYIHWLPAFMLSCVCACACVSVLCEHVASVLVFCVPGALMSICLDPTHLVTCLLIHFPQLFSLVTLIICSL